MAGRKPRQGNDEQGGTDQLKPHRNKFQPPKPFQPGNRPVNAFPPGNRISATGTLTHGITSKWAIRDRADAILEAMLTDPRCPDHLHSPGFAVTIMDWSKAEAVASLAFDWMCKLLEEGGEDGPGIIFGLQPGVMRAVSEVWKGHAAHADRLRSKLGLDPVSYAKIARDLGIASAATEDRLSRMAESGKEVTERRLGLVAGDSA